MQLIRPDLAEQAFQGLQHATEWPFYIKVVYIRPINFLILGHFERCSHHSLFCELVDAAGERGIPRPDLKDDDVVFGHIAWEDDGSHVGRTESGKPLPIEIEAVVDRLLAEKSGLP